LLKPLHCAEIIAKKTIIIDTLYAQAAYADMWNIKAKQAWRGAVKPLKDGVLLVDLTPGYENANKYGYQRYNLIKSKTKTEPKRYITKTLIVIKRLKYTLKLPPVKYCFVWSLSFLATIALFYLLSLFCVSYPIVL